MKTTVIYNLSLGDGTQFEVEYVKETYSQHPVIPRIGEIVYLDSDEYQVEMVTYKVGKDRSETSEKNIYVQLGRVRGKYYERR